MDIIEFFKKHDVDVVIEQKVAFSRTIIVKLMDNGCDTQILHARNSVNPSRATIQGFAAEWEQTFDIAADADLVWDSVFQHIIDCISNNRNPILVNTFNRNGVKRKRELLVELKDQTFRVPTPNQFNW